MVYEGPTVDELRSVSLIHILLFIIILHTICLIIVFTYALVISTFIYPIGFYALRSVFLLLFILLSLILSLVLVRETYIYHV